MISSYIDIILSPYALIYKLFSLCSKTIEYAMNTNTPFHLQSGTGCLRFIVC